MVKFVKFGKAVKALKEGKMITRSLWSGNPTPDLVFRQVPATIEGRIVPKMQSLPSSVKKELITRNGNCPTEEFMLNIHYEDQLAVLNSSNIIRGWSPSVAEVLAEDWIIVD